MRSRQTRQLAAIESVLRSARRPLAVTEIHAATRERSAGVGMATVYRALHELEAGRRIVRVEYAGQPTRYEWAVEEVHAHFICRRCQRVFDLEAPPRIARPRKRPPGFVIEGEEVIYYGVCAECRDGRHAAKQ